MIPAYIARRLTCTARGTTIGLKNISLRGGVGRGENSFAKEVSREFYYAGIMRRDASTGGAESLKTKMLRAVYTARDLKVLHNRVWLTRRYRYGKTAPKP